MWYLKSMVPRSAELGEEKMLPRPSAYFHRQGHPTAGHPYWAQTCSTCLLQCPLWVPGVPSLICMRHLCGPGLQKSYSGIRDGSVPGRLGWAMALRNNLPAFHSAQSCLCLHRWTRHAWDSNAHSVLVRECSPKTLCPCLETWVPIGTFLTFWIHICLSGSLFWKFWFKSHEDW